jgi:hypothetical protein
MSGEKGGLGRETGPSSESGLGQETGPSAGGMSGETGGLGQETGPSEATFRVQPGFQFFYTLPVLLAAAVLVDALLAPAADKWLLLLLTLVIAAISVPRGWSKVAVKDGRLALYSPLRQPRTVDLRGLVGLEISPRLGRALVLRYCPVDEQGRPDPASEAVLGLPPLQDQTVLEERLQAAIDERAIR